MTGPFSLRCGGGAWVSHDSGTPVGTSRSTDPVTWTVPSVWPSTANAAVRMWTVPASVLRPDSGGAVEEC